jgi:hypothetical protein
VKRGELFGPSRLQFLTVIGATRTWRSGPSHHHRMLPCEAGAVFGRSITPAFGRGGPCRLTSRPALASQRAVRVGRSTAASSNASAEPPQRSSLFRYISPDLLRTMKRLPTKTGPYCRLRRAISTATRTMATATIIQLWSVTPTSVKRSVSQVSIVSSDSNSCRDRCKHGDETIAWRPTSVRHDNDTCPAEPPARAQRNRRLRGKLAQRDGAAARRLQCERRLRSREQ